MEVLVLTMKNVRDYELQLQARPIVDAPDAAELVALLTAVEEWEAEHEPTPLTKAKPNDLT